MPQEAYVYLLLFLLSLSLLSHHAVVLGEVTVQGPDRGDFLS